MGHGVVILGASDTDSLQAGAPAGSDLDQFTADFY